MEYYTINNYNPICQSVINVPVNTNSTVVGILFKLQSEGHIRSFDELYDYIYSGAATIFSNDDIESIYPLVVQYFDLFEQLFVNNKREANILAEYYKDPIPYPELYKPPIKHPKPEKPKDDLYLIKNTINGFYKIGRSKNPESRLQLLNLASAEPLALVSHYEGKGYLEKQIHNLFSDKRLNTEWFCLENSDLLRINEFINN